MRLQHATGAPVIVPPAQKIRYWMRTPTVTINLAAPLSEALAMMSEYDVRRLPVVMDTGELCGMITQGDIRGIDLLSQTEWNALDIAETLRQVKVYSVMAEHPINVTPETSLREAALLMIENKIGGLPVVDEQQMVVGLITESDLFEALVQQLDSANMANG
jgi:CBS domain-containing protein